VRKFQPPAGDGEGGLLSVGSLKVVPVDELGVALL